MCCHLVDFDILRLAALLFKFTLAVVCCVRVRARNIEWKNICYSNSNIEERLFPHFVIMNCIQLLMKQYLFRIFWLHMTSNS